MSATQNLVRGGVEGRIQTARRPPEYFLGNQMLNSQATGFENNSRKSKHSEVTGASNFYTTTTHLSPNPQASVGGRQFEFNSMAVQNPNFPGFHQANHNFYNTNSNQHMMSDSSAINL